MKIKLLCLLLFGLFAMGFSQSFKSPKEYILFIKNEQTNISKSTWKFTSASALKNWRKIYETRKQLIKDLQSAKKKLGKIKDGYNGDVEYKNQIIHYFDLCEISLNEEYDKIINIDTLVEQSNDNMEAFMQVDDLVNAKLDAENEKVAIAYKAFMTKHNIELIDVESEWSTKIKVYNVVCDYYAKLNMIYFKVNFTDSNLTVAIRNGDVGAIQQNANALFQYATEGLTQLNTAEPYNGDYSVINAASKVLEYYKKQAEEYIPNVVRFLMLNDKFENAKITLESKTKIDRTQEEEQSFDLITKQMEDEIASFMKINYSNSKDKRAVLARWNTIGYDFIGRHIPKD